MTIELFEYGIQVENSDIRAHVSVVNQAIYVFPTRNGIAAIEEHRPDEVPAFQPGVDGVTALGWKVNIDWVNDLRCLQFNSWPRWSEFSEILSTGRKGALAVECVLDAMARGRFPLWLQTGEDKRVEVQRKGTDILLTCQKRIQVKCDYRCGHLPKGTGNLFLQRAERNPLKRH